MAELMALIFVLLAMLAVVLGMLVLELRQWEQDIDAWFEQGRAELTADSLRITRLEHLLGVDADRPRADIVTIRSPTGGQKKSKNKPASRRRRRRKRGAAR